MPTLPYHHKANSYLYDCGGNGRVVSDPRIIVEDNDNDFLTHQAQGMTPEEFRRFQNEQVDQEVTASFIAKIRNAIITQNENGEFLESRISPCVFTDDWVLKATHFIKKVMEGKQQQSGRCRRRRVKIQLEMQEKKNGLSLEGWLQVRVNNSYSLPLVMFTNRTLQDCLDKIITAVHKALTDMEFSSTPGANTIIAVAPLQSANELWQAHKEEAAAIAMGNEATKFHQRLPSSPSQEVGREEEEESSSAKNEASINSNSNGASRGKIKAKMERINETVKGQRLSSSSPPPHVGRGEEEEEEATSFKKNNEGTKSNSNFTNESFFNCITTSRQIWDSTVVYVPRKKRRRN